MSLRHCCARAQQYPVQSDTRSAILNVEKAVINPYAPPQSALKASGPECYRDGKLLVVPAGQGLPARCVKCNAPATMDKARTYSWHSPGWYLLLFVAVLVYLIAHVIVRKKVKLEIGLCAAHRQRRRNLNLTALGLFVAGGLCIFGAVHYGYEPLGWTAALVLLVSVVVAIFAGGIVSPTRIDDTEARFRGCGAAFLDSLPQR
jgi:hypothetical protein